MKSMPYLPIKNFMRLDNGLIFKTEISAAAFRLYCAYAHVKAGKDLPDAYLAKCFETSTKSVERWRSELVKANLVGVEKIGARTRIIWVASDQSTPKKAKHHYEEHNEQRN